MSDALEVLKRIVREEYKNIIDGVNIHPSGFRDYAPEEDSDFDEPHSTEKMESVNEKKIVNSALRKNITSTFKDLDKKFPKKAPRSQLKKITDYLASKYPIYNPRKYPGLSYLSAMIANEFYNYRQGKKSIKRAISSVINVQRGYPSLESIKEGKLTNKECCDNCKEGHTCCSVTEKKTMKITKTRIKEIIKEEIQSVLTEGTRWSVGIEAPSGKIASTYGHYDGYPEYAGKMLKRYYSNTGKVKQLMKLGKQGISTIDKSIKGGDDHSFAKPKKGETVFYGRDRGSKSSMSSTWRNRDKLKFNSGDEFAYIWSVKDKKWYYKSRYSNPQDWTELK